MKDAPTPGNYTTVSGWHNQNKSVMFQAVVYHRRQPGAILNGGTFNGGIMGGP